jgi:NAD(P)-dependent dehydrogenase (short-subunit alcohol dehydrogenase family)
MSDFSSRHVVVTGGAGALGSAVVDRLLAGAASVHVPCYEAEVPEHLRGRERLEAVPGVDMTDAEAVAEFYSALPDIWASIHVAGGFRMAPFADTSVADLRFLLELNVVTCFNASREAVRKMSTSGGGRIVNVTAKPALTPTQGAGLVAYASSKAAVAAMTQALGEEVAGLGILVNAIAPSIIDTPANRSGMPDADHEAWPKVEELASTIVHLASADNAVVRSALVPVYGRS